METTISFGYWIRRQRKALDLTQQALADKIGCSVAAIKKIENDERRPSRQIAERMAEILNVPVGQREIFLEAARGLLSVDQLSLAHEPAASSPPTGTVTFLFTDIEGSTKLAQGYPEEWETLRARHHAILHETIESSHGYVFQVVGDGICAAFHTANDGLYASIEAQRKLQTENWGEVPMKVRMGLHTGEAEAQGKEYRGYLTVSLVQRLMSAGHGGQILLSHATENLLRDHLPKDISLLDLGEHKFKDILQPVHIFQVIAPDLPKEFPALRALNIFPNNLPVQLTSFVGRQHELSEIKQLLATSHLLTLTGPGGTGKTRLALQLASEVLDAKDYSNGVWLIELAPLADPGLVTQTMASALGVREQPGRGILDALTDYLRAKSMLLILDNCEHLIATCAQHADTFLRAAPRLKILATSREALGITGETIYGVPSLPLPHMQQLHDLDLLEQNDCVRLFMDRALAAQPRFRLKQKNAPAIADICRRLDGIPLALELAAARIKVFLPEEIAARLDDRFKLLTGGSRTALERHQTLFALIDWSHTLLSESERLLLRRLSIFAGGWSFEAAQEVCGERLDDGVLDLLTHLVDKSLVAVEEETEEARYRLPETIRQYAREKLFESGEAEQIRNRHLEYFLRFGETAEPKLRSAEQLEWLARIEIEYDNLRTALGWSLESGNSESALRLSGALSYFWELRGLGEGCKWLDDALALAERELKGTVAEKAQRAKALYGSGRIRVMTLIDFHASRMMVEESLRLWRDLGDKWWMAVALENLGFISNAEGDVPKARAELEESVSLAREVGDPWLLAFCLERLAGVVERMDATAGNRIREEGVALARKVGDRSVLSEGLGDLAPFYQLQGNLSAAESVVKEALAVAREISDLVHIEISLLYLVLIKCLQGDTLEAKHYCFQAQALAQETGSTQWLVLAILGFGVTAIFSGQPERGLRMYAAVNTVLRQRDINLLEEKGEKGPGFLIFMRVLERAQTQLGPAAFQAAWTQGQQMTMEQALALATEDEGEDSQPLKREH